MDFRFDKATRILTAENSSDPVLSEEYAQCAYDEEPIYEDDPFAQWNSASG